MKKKALDLLVNPQRAVADAEDLLSRLWRIILRDIGNNPIKWNNWMERHLEDPRNKIANTSVARATVRGNINKELKDTQMTWKVFEKGISFLRPKKAEFLVRLTWDNGTTTEHAIVMPQRNSAELTEMMTRMLEAQTPGQAMHSHIKYTDPSLYSDKSDEGDRND